MPHPPVPSHPQASTPPPLQSYDRPLNKRRSMPPQGPLFPSETRPAGHRKTGNPEHRNTGKPENRKRKPDTGHRKPDTGHRTPDTGHRTTETGQRKPETGKRKPHTGKRKTENEKSPAGSLRQGFFSSKIFRPLAKAISDFRLPSSDFRIKWLAATYSPTTSPSQYHRRWRA